MYGRVEILGQLPRYQKILGGNPAVVPPGSRFGNSRTEYRISISPLFHRRFLSEVDSGPERVTR